VQLGLENKKKAMWAGALGVVALLLFVYEFIPMFSGSSSSPGSSAQAASPIIPLRATAGKGGKGGKNVRPESLDPTLQLQLLANVEQTQYAGSGRNIFVSKQEDVVIPQPNHQAATDQPKDPGYITPTVPQAPPIPLKFFGFASKPGEPKKIFLQAGEDVFVAGEGEIIDRRYKVVRISPNSVEMQDMVSSGPPQMIPLTQS
jgi:hypothetical protein